MVTENHTASKVTARRGVEREERAERGMLVFFSRKVCAKRRNWKELKERRSAVINLPLLIEFDVINNLLACFVLRRLRIGYTTSVIAVETSVSSLAPTSP